MTTQISNGVNYETLASADAVQKAVNALAERGIEATQVNNRMEALEKIKSFIPKGASVMNGSSRTLEEIGFVDYLKSGNHGWKNLHEEILMEKDPEKQAILAQAICFIGLLPRERSRGCGDGTIYHRLKFRQSAASHCFHLPKPYIRCRRAEVSAESRCGALSCPRVCSSS